MKHLTAGIILLLSACTPNSDQLDGAWSLTSANINGRCIHSEGHLWSDLIFQNDSILIFESQFFRGNQAAYKIEGDSIQFYMEENPTYHFSCENDRLEFTGEISIRGCKFSESKIYERNEHEYITKKIRTQDSINFYQLSFGSWCRDGVPGIEKHVSPEYSVFTQNINDSTGINYFPDELDFNAPNLIFTSKLRFSIEEQQYDINYYNGHQLTILLQSNDTTFYMHYNLCESRTLVL